MALALMFALWFAATLGLFHRTVHVPELAAAAVVSETGHAHATGLAALFGEHGEAECRLYDHLSGGPAALSVPLVVLPITLPAATFAFLQGEFIARWVALFDARGPPSTR